MSAQTQFFSRQFIFWSVLLALLVLFIGAFKSVLLPFILGAAIAYLLNPLVQRLEKAGAARHVAALVILGGFLLCLAALLALLAPLAYRQILQLSHDMPGYVDRFWQFVEPFSNRLESFLHQNNYGNLKSLLKDNAGSAVTVAKKFAGGLAAGGQALLDFLSIVFIMPVVAFFMMKDWDKITKWGADLLPRDHKNTIQQLLQEIDAKLAGFVRGQISVAVVLGLSYAVILSLMGLKYGFLIGLVSGLLNIIPLVGSVIGLVAGVLAAWLQGGDVQFILSVALIFVAGQIIEGNFLSPKLVGGSTGLHPLWVFFALMAGGALFGIVGMLVAVPFAAIAGVLGAFAIARYKDSTLYKGKTKRAPVKKKAKPKKKTVKK